MSFSGNDVTQGKIAHPLSHLQYERQILEKHILKGQNNELNFQLHTHVYVFLSYRKLPKTSKGALSMQGKWKMEKFKAIRNRISEILNKPIFALKM